MSNVTDLLDGASYLIAQAKDQINNPPLVYGGDVSLLPRSKPPLLVMQSNPAPYRFNEPTFNRPITKVTDNSMGGASWRVPSSAHLAAWSADSKSFYVVSSSGEIKLFNVGTLDLPTPSLFIPPYSQVEPTFSRVDKDIMFTVGGPAAHVVRQYRVSTGAYTDLVDVSKLGLNLPAEYYIGGIISSAAGPVENLVAFFGGGGQDAHHYVVADIGLLTQQVLDTAPLGYNLHAISVDMSGRYVFLYPTNSKPYQVVIWDLNNNSLTPVVNLPTGHDVQGYGVWINAACCSGAPYDNLQWQIRDLVKGDINNPKDLIVSPTPHETYIADHSSWNNAQPGKLVPFVSSTYRYQQTLNQTPWRAWDDEILIVETGGNGIVHRMAHHRSDVRNLANPDNPQFEYQPIANISPDGRRVLFMSNWEKTLGMDARVPSLFRTDVFMVKVGD